MPDLRARLIRCFTAVFPGLPGDEVPRVSKATFTDWDSLASFSLLTVVEEEFGILLSSDDVDEFVSFDRILDHLGRERAA